MERAANGIQANKRELQPANESIPSCLATELLPQKNGDL